MKKLLSLILALMMFALPCLAESDTIGGADDLTSLFLTNDAFNWGNIQQEALDAGRQVTVTLTVPELSGIATGDAATDAAIVDLVKALGLRVTTQGEEYDMGLSLNGKDVLSMGLATAGEDAYIKSNLIGGTIVLSMAEVEPIISRLLDMMVLMGAFTAEDAAEMKSQVTMMMDTFKASLEQGLNAQLDMDDLAEMDFSAVEEAAKAIRVEEVTEIIVPRMCDMATTGICVTIDNEAFVGLVKAVLECIKVNPMLMDYFAVSGGYPTEESRAADWAATGELYKMFGWYESEEEYIAANPTAEEAIAMVLEQLEGAKLLDGDFVTSLFFNDTEELVYLTSVLPMFTETAALYETEDAEVVNGTTEMLNVVYTRQTVAQGVSHVCNINVDGEGITIDMLAQEKAWTINLGELSTMETLLTIHAVEEDGVIKGDYTTYAEGPMGTFSFYHVVDDAQFKTDMAFTMELGEEYLTAHPTEEAFHLAIDYVCDYARNGVDFTGKETVTVGFNDVKVVLVGDIATSDPAESIMAGTVVRPAALDDAAFANWFVSAYNSLNSFLANLIMSLPESVLTLLIQTGMFG